MLRFLLSLLALISGLAVEARAAELPARAPVAAVQVLRATAQVPAHMARIPGGAAMAVPARTPVAAMAPAYGAPTLAPVAVQVDRARE